MNDEASGFTVLDVKTGQAAPLAMEGLWLAGRVLPVGARLLVVHTFRSAEARPLEVVYAFGLPRDAALRRFRIVGDGFQVRSDLRRLGEAQAEYERGISQGHLAALMRTYRDGRVNLSVGNIRPGELVKVYLELVAGVDLSDDGLRFRFPFTLAPCYHRGARAVEIEPGAGEMELPEAEFGDLLLPRYLTDTGALHSVGFDLSVGGGGAIGAVGSPSHALRIANLGTDDVRVGLSREKDVPDRDLVLDIRMRQAATRFSGGRCRDGKARFTAVVPSTLLGKAPRTSKSVVFVLDRSGSMAGPAIEQAKKAVEACLGTLGESDRFGFVAFDDQADLFAPSLAHASIENRQLLRQFLLGIDARGGTELGQGLREAVRLAGADRVELILITDGQVAGTEDLLGQVQAAGARLHCLGIGAASQDRFLTLLARTSGGVSRFPTPRERVDTAALDLFAAIGAPVASDVQVDFGELPGGRGILKTVSSVYAGHPLVVMGETSGEARGSLRVTWNSGGSAGELRVDLQPSRDCEAETVRLLQGARLITELESGVRGEWPANPQRAEAKREDRRLIEKLEATSLEYGLASRAMALVAIV
ncbi:MAG TPA: VWA domain-containing protein, partial [Candidatus Paceibacterota bacterium]|nr:VWA domain-containing protein [Candidatus Paceibacterota bacterium]